MNIATETSIVLGNIWLTEWLNFVEQYPEWIQRKNTTKRKINTTGETTKN